MKFSFPNTKHQQQEKIVLFVCAENAGRSQMAEGFFNRKYAPKGYRAISAGMTNDSSYLPKWSK
jgi:arsenate reductase